MTRISVIIPVYNAEAYLEKCLDSVIGQSLDKIEIICIDDGSSDNSLAILKKYQADGYKVVIISQCNLGSGLARNAGIDAAIGEYIAFMDADDYYPNPYALEKLYQCAKRYNADIIGGSARRKARGRETTEALDARFCFGEERCCDYAKYQFPFGYWRYIFRKGFIAELDIKFPAYRRFQDPPFLVKAMIAAGKFYSISDCVYVYRETDKLIDYNNRELLGDLLQGIEDVICLARENKYEILQSDIVEYLNGMLPYFYRSIYLGNTNLEKKLKETIENIDVELLRKDARELEKPRELSKGEIKAIFLAKEKIQRSVMERLAGKNMVIIYGAGVGGRRFYKYLKAQQFSGRIEFVVSAEELEKNEIMAGVHSIEDFEVDRKHAILFVAKGGEGRHDMKKRAEKLGYCEIQILDLDMLKICWGFG